MENSRALVPQKTSASRTLVPQTGTAVSPFESQNKSTSTALVPFTPQQTTNTGSTTKEENPKLKALYTLREEYELKRDGAFIKKGGWLRWGRKLNKINTKIAKIELNDERAEFDKSREAFDKFKESVKNDESLEAKLKLKIQEELFNIETMKLKDVRYNYEGIRHQIIGGFLEKFRLNTSRRIAKSKYKIIQYNKKLKKLTEEKNKKSSKEVDKIDASPEALQLGYNPSKLGGPAGGPNAQASSQKASSQKAISQEKVATKVSTAMVLYDPSTGSQDLNKKIYMKLSEIEENMVDEQDTTVSKAEKSSDIIDVEIITPEEKEKEKSWFEKMLSAFMGKAGMAILAKLKGIGLGALGLLGKLARIALSPLKLVGWVFRKGKNLLMPLISEGFSKILGGFKTLGDFVKGHIDNAIQGVKNFFQSTFDKWGQKWADLTSKVSDIASNVLAKGKGLLSNAKDKAVNFANKVKDKASGVFSWVKEKVVKVTSAVKDSVVKVYEFGKKKVSEVTGPLLEKAKKFVMPVMEKIVTKAGGKGAFKTLTKTLLKKIPGVGIFAGLGFGIHQLMKGNYKKAGLEVLSGLVSTVPGIGTAASLGIDAVNMTIDDNETKAPGKNVSKEKNEIKEYQSYSRVSLQRNGMGKPATLKNEITGETAEIDAGEFDKEVRKIARVFYKQESNKRVGVLEYGEAEEIKQGAKDKATNIMLDKMAKEYFGKNNVTNSTEKVSETSKSENAKPLSVSKSEIEKRYLVNSIKKPEMVEAGSTSGDSSVIYQNANVEINKEPKEMNKAMALENIANNHTIFAKQVIIQQPNTTNVSNINTSEAKPGVDAYDLFDY